MTIRSVRRTTAAIVVALSLGLAALAAGATAAVPPPPPNAGYLSTEWPLLTSLTGDKAQRGEFTAEYDAFERTLTWSIAYIGTTGPATAVRLRMHTSAGLLSLSLCRGPCKSKTAQGKKGPYFILGGTIRHPTRDLVIAATKAHTSDLILATAEYPRGEMRAAFPPYTPPAESTGPRCC